jgi:hypothetical protein
MLVPSMWMPLPSSSVFKTLKRHRRNHIASLRDGERIAVDQADMESLAAGFFHDLLGRARPRAHDLDLGSMGLAPVDLSGLSGLEALFSERRSGTLSSPCPPISRLDPMGCRGNSFGLAGPQSRMMHWRR